MVDTVRTDEEILARWTAVGSDLISGQDLRDGYVSLLDRISVPQAAADALASKVAVIYAEDFGANPNGVYDDNAAAINSAIEEASNYTVAGQRYGGRVQLLRGNYLINETIHLRALSELAGITRTSTTISVEGGANCVAVQTLDDDQILYGIRDLCVFGNATSQGADDGTDAKDFGGVYLINAKATTTGVGIFTDMGGCRSWARNLFILKVAGTGFKVVGNSSWKVSGIDVHWAQRYGIHLDANDGTFDQMIASRVGWAGMFVDGSSSRINNVKTWFTGVELDTWALARDWAQTNSVTAYNRQFDTNQKAGVGLLVRGDHNRMAQIDVQDTAGHGAYIHCRFGIFDPISCDQVGQVNSGGTTTRYDGGGAGANDWIDLNPGVPLVGVYVAQNQRGYVRANVVDINYGTDGTPGGSVLHDVLEHLVWNAEAEMELAVTGHEAILEQHDPVTDPVISESPYRLNGVESEPNPADGSP